MDILIIIPLLVPLPLNSPLSAPCLIWPHRATCKAVLCGTKETLLFQVLIVESAESQAARHDKASRMNKYYAAGTATFRCVKEDKSRNKARKHQQTKTWSYSNINVRQDSIHLQRAKRPYRFMPSKKKKGGGWVDESLSIHITYFFCRVSDCAAQIEDCIKQPGLFFLHSQLHKSFSERNRGGTVAGKWRGSSSGCHGRFSGC